MLVKNYVVIFSTWKINCKQPSKLPVQQLSFFDSEFANLQTL